MSIVAVDCESLSSNPRCPHGPMVKFSKRHKETIAQFYGCTACRDPKDCPFSLDINDQFSEHKLRAIEDAKEILASRRNHKAAANLLQKVLKLKPNLRRFCKTCFDFVLPDQLCAHDDHELVSNISDDMLSLPSRFLSAKTNDKKEAQYWFDASSKSFAISVAKHLNAKAVLCIGTPSVFEEARKTWDHRMLLDIDPRYMTFYNEKEFGWFNMMNFHFFRDESKRLKTLRRLMKHNVCVFLDPPFGVRLELLSYTINILHSMASNIFIFLALPYFMEPHVNQHLNFHMLDYVIHYENHSKMKSHKKSVVRFFTNVPLQDVPLPEDEGYKFCDKCGCWRHENNAHCDLCRTCPSKNASTYRHCFQCGVCVKSTWEHCSECARCFLAPHKCDDNPLLTKRARSNQKKRKKRKIAS